MQPLVHVAGTTARQGMGIVRSWAVVGLAWLVTVLVLMISVRLVRQIHRQSHR